MKIGFLSHLDLNLYLFRLPIMKELVKRGHKVYAITPKGDVFDKFKEFGIETIDYKIERASLNPLNELKTIQDLKIKVRGLDLDILHSFMHKPNIYGSFTDAQNFIQTVTGLGSFFIYDDLKSKIIKNVILTGYKISSKKAKKVIFQNSDDLEMFVKFGIIPREKAVLVKSSGIDTSEWKMESGEVLGSEFQVPSSELRVKNEKPIVLMIARVIKDKGVEEFIKAVEILKDKAEFWYAGDIDKGNKNAFNPDWKNINYLGFRRDIKDLISKCDIFVLPSFYGEGVPRTLIEAASMSKPIVTTNNRGCKEVVDDGINGFLVPIKDYKSLAKKIEILIDNPKLRDEFGKKSREKAVNEFDIKAVVDKYLAVYEEILGSEK